MDRTPLATLLGRLPQIMRARYAGGNDSLWVTLFNQVLNDIETTMRAPELMATAVVRYEDLGLTNPAPVGLSRVLDARTSSGDPVRISASGTSWTVLDDGLPGASQEPVSEKVSGSARLSGRGWVSVLSAEELDAQAGYGAIVTKMSGGTPLSTDPVVASWIIPAVARRPGLILIAKPGEDGEFVDLLDSGLAIHVVSEFLAVDGIKALQRATTTASLSPLSPRWDYVLVDGLEALGEEMTKRSSQEARAARAKYEGKKDEMGAWASSFRPEMARPRLKSISLPRAR